MQPSPKQQPSPTPRVQRVVEQLASMRDMLKSAHQELTRTEVTGEAGGGLVRVTAYGTGEVTEVRLDPRVRRREIRELERLILEAIQEAQQLGRGLVEQLSATLTDVSAPRQGA
jgi:nucleoid-associated protein EbfC